MMKKVVIFLMTVAFMLSLVGCKKNEETKIEPKEKNLKEEVVETQEKIPENENLLTGIPNLTEEAIGKRPVAVMVNNVSPAMPQYGIEKADIIFEIPVEGNETRFMALYADYTTIPKVCAIRSCRYYFPALALGFDAFYINWGIDDTIYDYLSTLKSDEYAGKLDQYDGINGEGGFFGRDQTRLNEGYALEHTGYFDGTQFASVVQAEGKRTDLLGDKKKTAFQFNGLSEQIKAPGAKCTVANIDFGAQSATFTYDAERKVYLKQNNGKVQIDGNTGNQLAFTNVLVLETEIGVRDAEDHKSVKWDGSATSVGYYISNGGIQKIYWAKEKNNEWSDLRFFNESEHEIKINRGKSYIALNYPGQSTFQ